MAPVLILLCFNMLMFGTQVARHGESYTNDGWIVFYRLACLHLLLLWGGWYAPLFAR